MKNLIRKIIAPLAFVGAVSLGSLLGGCSIPVQATGNVGVTVDTAQDGMIYGKTKIPSVSSGQLIWVGQAAKVTISGNGGDYTMESESDGTYAKDGIPTGSYNVSAQYSAGQPANYANLYGYTGSSSGIVTRQGQTEVDIQMNPGFLVGKGIIYGKISYSNGSPYANQQINLYDASSTMYDPSTGSSTPVYNLEGSATTSINGSYAFSVNVCISNGWRFAEKDSSGKNITINGNTLFSTDSNLYEADGTVSPQTP